MGKLATLATQVNAEDSPIQKEMNRFILIMTFRSILFGS
jgi:magnesium-transporting ATPase (P-type)